MSSNRSTKECYFCRVIQGDDRSLAIIPDLDLGLFVAAYDGNPVTPGHALVIPKRHVRYMRDLSIAEAANLLTAVVRAKERLMDIDHLRSVYETMLPSVAGTKSEAYIARALGSLVRYNRSPDSFNDGLNDGPAAGQTVPHFHWHIMPRWQGDVEDPRGGVRCMLPGGNYYNGLVSVD